MPAVRPSPPPPDRVLRAFGTHGPASRLPGGQGTSWRAGSLVLKPGTDGEEARWLAEVLDSVREEGFRVPRPARTADGRCVVEGWSAARWVAGEAGPVGRWADLFATSRAFHRAVRHVSRPAVLDHRDHAWARADRSAWGERPPPGVDGLEPLRSALARYTQPVREPAQLVHGDLSGNVLFADGLAPAVIDLSPYWRPPAFADAVAVADGLLWWGQGGSAQSAGLLAAAGRAGEPAWVARGLLFRLDTLGHQLADSGSRPRRADLAPYAAALEVLAAA